MIGNLGPSPRARRAGRARAEGDQGRGFTGRASLVAPDRAHVGDRVCHPRRGAGDAPLDESVMLLADRDPVLRLCLHALDTDRPPRLKAEQLYPLPPLRTALEAAATIRGRPP